MISKSLYFKSSPINGATTGLHSLFNILAVQKDTFWRHGVCVRGDWKCGSRKCDTGKIARVENAGVENAGV